MEGTELTLTTQIESTESFDVIWKKNGRVVPNCKDFEHTVLDNGKVCLRISDAFAEDSGRYECEASNCFGSTVSSCGVAVNGKLYHHKFSEVNA